MESWVDQAVELLAKNSWCHLPSALPEVAVEQLSEWIDSQMALGLFKSAGIGKGDRFQTNESIRRDMTLWLDDEIIAPELDNLRKSIELLRSSLNRELFAGLDSFEGHFAVYPPGGFYKRHVDTFRDEDARSITFILYLNRNWVEGDGGELLLVPPNEREIKISPKAGSIVIFESRKFPHEVLLARTERRSFTGWFKVRKMQS